MGSPSLTYTIAPASVSAGATGVSFTVTAMNKTSSPVTFNSGDSIRIGQLTQLTAGAVTPTKPSGNWYFTLQSNILKAFVTTPTTIPANDGSLQLVFSIATVVGAPGIAQLTVVETREGNAQNAPDLSITIKAALTITATATPSTVGAGQRSQIQWTAVGAAYVTITPGPSTHYPVPAGNTMVIPLQNQTTTVYTVTAVAADGTTANTPVTITLAGPKINFFTATPNSGVAIPGTITLKWETTYASSVQIQPQSGSPFVGASGQLMIPTPGPLVPDQNQIIFTLTASGYGPSATATKTVTFAPMQVLWFRYTDFTKSGFSFYVQNVQLSQVSSNLPYTLVADGPGGPLTATLGGNGLEIQVMTSTPATITSGQSAELQYLIANATPATVATLSPGNVPLTFDATGKGSVSVSPPGTTPYIITATTGTTTVTSQYTLIVTT